MPTSQNQASYGWATALGLSKEVTYGTAVAPTLYIPFTNDSMTLTNKLIQRMGVRKTKGRTISSPGQVDVKGSFEVEAEPDTIGQLLALACGTDSVAGSGAYVHTIKLASPMPSFTLSADYGLNSVHQWTGVKVESLDISNKMGGLLMAKFGLIGQNDVILPATSLSPTFGVLQPYEAEYITTATLNGVPIPFESFNISLKNNLAPYFGAGSARLVRNINEKNAEVSGSMITAYESDILQNLALAGTNVPLVITYTHPSIASGATPYSLTITLPNIIIEAAPVDPKRNDVLMSNIKFIAHESATGAQDDIKLTITNAVGGSFAP